jgi:hypothetical protein
MQAEEQQAKTQTAGPISHWDPERDRPRGKELIKVEVHNRSTLNLQIPRGWLLQPGVQTVEIYVDELPAVMAMVEPEPMLLELSERAFRLALADEAKERFDGFSGTAEQFLKLIADGDRLASDAYEYVRARTTLSPQAEFRKTNKRDPLPLVSCKVVERNVPEQQRESVKLLQAEQSRFTENLAAGIAAGIADKQKVDHEQLAIAVALGVGEAIKPLVVALTDAIKQSAKK